MAEHDPTNPVTRTVHELTPAERNAVVDAFRRAHNCSPHWGIPSDRAWMEGYAAGRADVARVGEAPSLSDEDIDRIQEECDAFCCESCDVRMHEFARAIAAHVSGVGDNDGVPVVVDAKPQPGDKERIDAMLRQVWAGFDQWTEQERGLARTVWLHAEQTTLGVPEVDRG